MAFHTDPHGSRATELSFQPVGILCWRTGSVRICQLDGVTEPQNGSDESCPQDGSSARRHMRVIVKRENSQNIVVFMHGLAEIASLLLVGPVSVRIAV